MSVVPGSGPQSPPPAAGWYPDPSGGANAWWNGRAWADGSRDRPAPAQETSSRLGVPFPSGDSSSGLAGTGDDLAGVANKPATIGFVLGLAAMVVNPVLVCGLAAIVFASIGVNRATLMGQQGFSAVGKRKAAWGLGLGLLATAVSIAFKGALF